MGEPIMPVRGYTHAIHLMSPRAGMMVIPDAIDRAHGGVEVTVVALDVASWQAAVERAAKAQWDAWESETAHMFGDNPTPWSEVWADQAEDHRKSTAALLRAFLNLPDDWRPE